MAQAFCENPEGYNEVNHINENKEDNRADNLEYCSRAYNNNYGTRSKRAAEKLRGKKQSEESIKKRSKPVFSIDKESGLIMYWESINEAERCTGIANSGICACLKGKRKSAGNHIWFYAESVNSTSLAPVIFLRTERIIPVFIMQDLDTRRKLPGSIFSSSYNRKCVS